MAYSEEIFLWLSIALYSFSFLLFLGGLVFRKEAFQAYAFRVSVLAVLFHTGAMLARWAETGHLPVMGTYENSIAGSWFMAVTYIIFRYVFPPSKPFGVAVMPLALLILGNGLQAEAVLQPLEPPYRSNWLYIHVLFAWFAFGAYAMALGAGALYLLKGWRQKGVLGRLPELKLLDELSLRLILFGFFAEAIMIGSGAIWAHGLWGRYWGWDPVETWSLISWLTYGVNIHLRVTMGWSGKRAAWLAIGSLFGIIFTFFGIGYVSELHTAIF